MYEQRYLKHSTLPFYVFQCVHKKEVGKKQSCALQRRDERAKQSFLHKDKSESCVLMYQTF